MVSAAYVLDRTAKAIPDLENAVRLATDFRGQGTVAAQLIRLRNLEDALDLAYKELSLAKAVAEVLGSDTMLLAACEDPHLGRFGK